MMLRLFKNQAWCLSQFMIPSNMNRANEKIAQLHVKEELTKAFEIFFECTNITTIVGFRSA